ncbi:MAG: sensor histidine kinase, partial [Segetibacter sp.]
MMTINNFTKNVVFVLVFIMLTTLTAESKPIVYINNFPNSPIGTDVELLIDSNNILNSENILNAVRFAFSQKKAPIYFLSDKTLWGRFSVTNHSGRKNIFFSIEYPNISLITFYRLNDQNKLDSVIQTGHQFDFSVRPNNDVDFNFPLQLDSGKTGIYYFKIKSRHPVELRMALMSASKVSQVSAFQSLIAGTYLGIIGAILLYNLFLCFATRDRSYIVYVTYLFALVLAQLTLSGLSFKYFWPSFPALNQYAVIWTSCFAGISAMVFAMSFLHTSTYLPKLHIFLKMLIALYGVAILLSFTPFTLSAYRILNFNGIVSGFTLIFVSASIYKKGYRPALYYLFAWSAFLVGLIILVLRNMGFVAVNNFTNYVLYGGSAIETILLSIALADKISILRKEKDASQQEALCISKENEKLVKEQNIVLERRVAERTEALQLANNQATIAFKGLKDTQIQLVEAEKMASLGQLTAGIAHEINNPINFVKSNIKPLQLDFKDLMEVIGEYEKLHTVETSEIEPHLKEIEALKRSIDLDFLKTEIGELMKGIENGAERTAEIVRGLRTFSRLDESVIKTVDIHEGIDSTLILLRSNVPANLTIVKEYNVDGDIECYPGKLNQVFMNILSNAIHAIKSKPEMTADEKIIISTSQLSEHQIVIKIKDSGKGMSKETKQKIYDPFFTTKDVGEGTGLGLAIVFKIIQEHSGKIEVISEEGKG